MNNSKPRPFYIRTAKTGSSSLDRICSLNSWPKTDNKDPLDTQFKKFSEFSDPNVVMFTTVRSPFTRAVSQYYESIRKGWINRHYSFYEYWEIDPNRINNSQSESKHHWITHYQPLVDYLAPVLDQIGFVIRLETIQQDVNELCNLVGSPRRPVTHARPGQYEKSQVEQIYSEKHNIEIIQQVFRKDFEHWGYDINEFG